MLLCFQFLSFKKKEKGHRKWIKELRVDVCDVRLKLLEKGDAFVYLYIKLKGCDSFITIFRYCHRLLRYSNSTESC